jgi:hypothetical protein
MATMYENLCVDGVELTFHMRAFDFFYTTVRWLDNFQNCTTMKFQKNVNSMLHTEWPNIFSYIVAIFIHNNFESPNTFINSHKFSVDLLQIQFPSNLFWSILSVLFVVLCSILPFYYVVMSVYNIIGVPLPIIYVKYPSPCR